MNPQIIGLTGSFGSGCTYVAKKILVPLGYEHASLSQKLRDEFSASDHDASGDVRRKLQDFGDKQREEKGPEYFARQVREDIETAAKGNASQKWVVDSIRNPAEVHHLREVSTNFFLFGVYATKDRRWQRKQSAYRGNRRTFDEDDERDTGRHSQTFGQRVEDCFVEADVVFSNNEDFDAVGNVPFGGFKGKVESYVDLVSNPLSRRQPTQAEALMAAAYTVSQRSSCLKRKVGAVIVDGNGAIISSGFNEVPRHSRPCVERYRTCGRAMVWKRVSDLLAQEFPNSIENHQSLIQHLRLELRILDHCRALHAEENAIVSLARNGRSVPLGECTLYTTTFPCRLCANKIVNLGIERVVYLEPYPDQEARVILDDGGVEDEFFEGITFKAYPRIYGEKK